MAKQASKTATQEIGVAEALKLSGFDNAYLRRLLGEGKIEAEKRFITGTRIPKWFINKASLVDYVARGSKTRRKDGRNKYTCYLTPAEHETLQAICKDADFQLIIKRTNLFVDGVRVS